MSELIGYALFLVMGVILGMIGAGGSILTIPILVYLFDVPPIKATSYSLFIVGLSAFAGSLRVRVFFKQRKALLFALPSVFAVFIARYFLTPIMPEKLGALTLDAFMMMLLSVIMLFAGFFMVRTQTFRRPTHHYESAQNVVIIALIFGLIMGFMGVGGGFLIVPVLVFLLHIPMKDAVSTSLAIITLNAAVGFLADHHHLVWLDYKRLLIFSALAMAGLIVGMSFQEKIDDAVLRRIFGWFVVVLALIIGVKEMLMSS